MNELALFAGAGGGILGGHLLGWRTVCAVELNEYCRRVLMQRQDDGIFEPFPIWDDITTFDGKPFAGCVDIVTGGFPCQDISAAGRGAGIAGERSGLWSEMARIIGEVRPRFVLVENSPMLTLRGLGTVLGDLAALGFDAEWGCVSAADTGAPHKRDRIWIVANTPSQGSFPAAHAGVHSSEEGTRPRHEQSERYGSHDVADPSSGRRGRPETGKIQQSRRAEVVGASFDLPNPNGDAIQRLESESQQSRYQRPTGLHDKARSFPDWPADPADASQSGVGRVVDGCANRVERLRALGNAQVPRVAATAFTELAGRLKNA